MQGWFNIQILISIIHYINRLKKKSYIIMSIDAEKNVSKSGIQL